MANKNTKYARSQGYSDMTRLDANRPLRGNKNYGTRTGFARDTSALRKLSGKRPYDPQKNQPGRKHD